jgi:hypothetical protein
MNDPKNKYNYEIVNNTIRFIRDFNEPLDNYLHLIQQCQEVWFVSSFNKSINNLPDHIKKITIENEEYYKPITNFPSQLEEFNFHTEFYYFPNDKMFAFPKTLKKLGWYCYGCENLAIYLAMLPDNLEVLTIGIEFKVAELNHFTNLTNLTIDIEDFNEPLDNLPNTIKKLSIYSTVYNQPLNNLPNGLIDLHFSTRCECNDYTFDLDYLPQSLEKLILPGNYKGNLDNLPSNLKYLEISYDFEKSINNLPDSIETLFWLSIYEYKGKITKLPINLKEVIFGHNYQTKNMKQKIRKILLINTNIKITDYFEVEK